MRFLVLIVLALNLNYYLSLAASIRELKLSTREHFDTFINKYGKSFVNLEDKQKRYEIFAKNLEEIEEFNQIAEAQNITFRLGINPFSELEYEEFISLYTGLMYNETEVENEKQEVENEKPVFISNLQALQATPASKNWVAEGKVVPVKNQGSCGACWAFATVAVVESLNAINGGPLTSLSEQQLMDCNYDSSKGNWACQGGFFPTAFSYVRGDGIMRRSEYPYTGKRSYCRYAETKAVAKLNRFNRVTNEDDLKTVIGNYGPVAIGIHVSPYFQRYSSGIIDDPSCVNQAPNHGVTVVGYGTDRGHEYWLVRNSWGPNWGESGYFRMARNKNMCNIMSMAYYARD